MGRPVAILLAFALLAHAPGCVTKRVKKALEEETRVSLTVTGAAPLPATLGTDLARLHKVGATVETLEKGVRILKLVGAYKEVVDALVWLITQNLKLLANDEVSRVILEIALAAAK
jgi:hypothetical protein